MTNHAKAALACVSVLVAAGCQATPGPVAPLPGSEVDVRQTMIEGLNPAALAIWEAGEKAGAAQGAPVASTLDAPTLARVREAAQMLVTYAAILDEAPVLKASGPDLIGDRVPPGIASRAQIQAAIDANPGGFRAYSREMGTEAQAILAAIEAGDRAAVADRLASFDGACQSCHERYWYVAM